MSWFHGKINREEAEHRLKYQGDYLVRSHGNGQFVLSCMDSGNAKHLLLVDPQGQVQSHLFCAVIFHVLMSRDSWCHEVVAAYILLWRYPILLVGAMKCQF